MGNSRRFKSGLGHSVPIFAIVVLCVVFAPNRYRAVEAQVACDTSNLPCLDDATNTVTCIVSSAPCCEPSAPDCFYSFGTCCGPSCGPLGGPSGASYYLAICNEGSPCPTCPSGGGGGGCPGSPGCCHDQNVGCVDDIVADPDIARAADPWLGSTR